MNRDTTPVRPAPTTIVIKGIKLAQVKRVDNLAIYSITHPSGSLLGYEVVRLRVGKPHPKDKDQSPKEHYPSAEQWGSYGWTCLTLNRAEEKLRELQDSLNF